VEPGLQARLSQDALALGDLFRHARPHAERNDAHIGNGFHDHDNPDPWYWFDATAFVAPPPNNYGNVARGVLYSPGVVNIDMSVVKTFPITERLKFNFRFEAFNLFNTPYFGFPDSAIGSPTVGRITSTVGDNRSLQLSGRITF
jgi:hypothetical protein